MVFVSVMIFISVACMCVLTAAYSATLIVLGM